MEQLTVKLKDQPVASIGGLRMVDEETLKSFTSNYGPTMELIAAHLFSKANLHYGVLAGKKGKCLSLDRLIRDSALGMMI